MGLTFDAEDVHGPLILEPLHGVLHATTAARQGSEHARYTRGLVGTRSMARLAYKRATRVCYIHYIYRPYEYVHTSLILSSVRELSMSSCT